MIYVILSAFLYILASLYPIVSLVFMTTFLIPLCVYKLPSQRGSRFGYGLLWGFVVFAIHWSWILVLLTKKTTTLLSFFAWTLLVLWCSCWSGLWFYVFPYARLWSTILFFICMSRYSLFFTGVVEGYPLFSPLISIAQYPSMLSNLYWLSDIGMLAIIFGLQIKAVDLWRFKDKTSFFVVIFCFSFLAQGYWSNPSSKPLNTSSMITVCPWWYGCGDPMFAGYRMSHDLCDAIQKNPEAKLVVMPESTYCWDIQEYASFLPVWSDSANGASILFGAHETDGLVSHNAIFLLHKNEFVFRYRKRHFMPLIERSIWIEQYIGKALLLNQLIMSLKTNDDDLVVVDNVTYQLFVCSELFFESKATRGYPVVLLWNDTWLCFDWVKKLASLFIIYFEKKYHVFVLHMSTQGRTNINLT